MHARVAIYEDVDLDSLELIRGWMDDEGVRMSRGLPGYLGSVTLVDRAARRALGVGLYADEAGATNADEQMRSGLPPGVPDDVAAAMRSSTVGMSGVFEVIQNDGVTAGTA